MCSVILGQLESFRNFKVLTKKRIFLIPLSIIFLNPKVLGFLFSMKNRLTWGVKCGKLNYSVGNLLVELRKLYMSGAFV